MWQQNMAAGSMALKNLGLKPKDRFQPQAGSAFLPLRKISGGQDWSQREIKDGKLRKRSGPKLLSDLSAHLEAEVVKCDMSFKNNLPKLTQSHKFDQKEEQYKGLSSRDRTVHTEDSQTIKICVDLRPILAAAQSTEAEEVDCIAVDTHAEGRYGEGSDQMSVPEQTATVQNGICDHSLKSDILGSVRLVQNRSLQSIRKAAQMHSSDSDYTRLSISYCPLPVISISNQDMFTSTSGLTKTWGIVKPLPKIHLHQGGFQKSCNMTYKESKLPQHKFSENGTPNFGVLLERAKDRVWKWEKSRGRVMYPDHLSKEWALRSLREGLLQPHDSAILGTGRILVRNLDMKLQACHFHSQSGSAVVPFRKIGGGQEWSQRQRKEVKLGTGSGPKHLSDLSAHLEAEVVKCDLPLKIGLPKLTQSYKVGQKKEQLQGLSPRDTVAHTGDSPASKTTIDLQPIHAAAQRTESEEVERVAADAQMEGRCREGSDETAVTKQVVPPRDDKCDPSIKSNMLDSMCLFQSGSIHAISKTAQKCTLESGHTRPSASCCVLPLISISNQDLLTSTSDLIKTRGIEKPFPKIHLQQDSSQRNCNMTFKESESPQQSISENEVPNFGVLLERVKDRVWKWERLRGKSAYPDHLSKAWALRSLREGLLQPHDPGIQEAIRRPGTEPDSCQQINFRAQGGSTGHLTVTDREKEAVTFCVYKRHQAPATSVQTG